MANKIVDFTDLIIYQLAVDLADWIYELTARFPEDEKYNLTSQIRRSSTSVYSNIAEGFGRYHYKENKQFCRIARGSLYEIKSHVLFSHKRGYISQQVLDEYQKRHTTLAIKLNNYINATGISARKMSSNVNIEKQESK
ncbi:four helix bundle protein [candidate division TA06 bacterium]|nr:four helix bundle protein [candidate division TA06 bacterium]